MDVAIQVLVFALDTRTARECGAIVFLPCKDCARRDASVVTEG